MMVTIGNLSKNYQGIHQGGKAYIDMEALTDAGNEIERLRAECDRLRGVSYGEGFSASMTKAVSRVEALLEGMAKSGIYVLDQDETIAVLRRALDRADRHEAGVLETLTLMGIVLARRGS